MECGSIALAHNRPGNRDNHKTTSRSRRGVKVAVAFKPVLILTYATSQSHSCFEKGENLCSEAQ